MLDKVQFVCKYRGYMAGTKKPVKRKWLQAFFVFVSMCDT